MKTFTLLVLLALTLPSVARLGAADGTQTPKAMATKSHRVVFELTSAEPEAWNAILNNVENVRMSLGEASTQVELVAHGKGLDFLKASNATLKDRMHKLADEGVVFAACENTMRRMKVTKAELVPFAITVDSGVAEVVRKQEAGWSYVRTGG